MFIMGLVLLVAMPYLGGYQSSRLKSEARRLAGRSNYLYEEAGAQKVLLRLTFDLDNNAYLVTRMDPFTRRPRFVPETGPAGRPVKLPSGVRLRDVWVEGIGNIRRGTISSQYYPGGTADAALIHLTDEHGNVITLAINPYNGRAAIERGDLSLEAMASSSL